MKYSAVIFDLDGTLCDTMPDIHASVNIMLKQLGYPVRTFEHTIMGLNRGSRYLIAHALPENASDEEIDCAMKIYMKIYREHLCENTNIYPGVYGLISNLSDTGTPLAILSNKPDIFVKAMADRYFPGKFMEALGQGRYPVKPSPEAPLSIAQTLGIEPNRILFVGDSDVDIKTAHNAGMTACGVLWGYRGIDILREAGAEFIVSNPDEIMSILKT